MNIPSIVSSLLRTSAPTLLTALVLPPPFNLIASGVVTAVLNKYLPADQTPAQPGTQPTAPPAMTPEQVTEVIQKNAGDPALLADLQKAELQLKQFEAENNLKFAELEVEDRTRAGNFQLASGLSQSLLIAGMTIVGVAVVAMLLLVAGSILLLTGMATLPEGKANQAVGVFGLIGAVVGYISGYASQIVSFYYGSSQGSLDKTQALTDQLQRQGTQIAQHTGAASTAITQAAERNERVIDRVTAAFKEGQATRSPATSAAQPAAPALNPAGLRGGPFGGVRWWLTGDGIILQGETSPERTVGEPVTVRRIWANYAKLIKAAASTFGVPAELIVTVIAVESRGVVNAERTEPDERESVGLMQTLIGTAREALNRPNLSPADLLKPDISINAGTAYIVKLRPVTNYDPILNGAAYNAGKLAPARPGTDDNPYNLRSTGDHLDRTRRFYNDTVAVSKAEGWFASVTEHA